MAQHPQSGPGAKSLSAAAGSPPKSSHGSAAEPPRRSFLQKALAVVIGGIVSIFPAAAGLAVFVDPLRSRKKKGEGESADEGFLKVASLDSLLVGSPRQVTVINDRVDAWNLFPREPVGAVYLLRQQDGTVLALNRVCPHAGCLVDFNADQAAYLCPCHKSSFKLDGSIKNEDSPSPRGLDSLIVDAEKLKAGEVWIKFQNFQSGKAEKVAET